MVWLFLVPLGVAIAAFFVSQHSQDELAILSAVIALVGLIFSLVLAPWQIQLAILVIALFMSRRAVRWPMQDASSQHNHDSFPTLYNSNINRQKPW